ncbi:MAG TPA: peptide-methionine (S)-S-oxide reductase MsrA [Chitinophagales bacterium]|nr:peptide-methionine (S)-S-oxide reductase MsrA [Chitinophagales bacterium]HNM31571.1 peptide-methionine (S)-S-oxide reductase MsrA [Chitinophagales bacterium]
MNLRALFLWLIAVPVIAGCRQVKTTPSTIITTQKNTTAMENNRDTITLGGGCYWCMEAVFQQLNGVVQVVSGFSGGQVENPTYKEVCTGLTGHAEVVQIEFDSSKITLLEILKVFFTMHDPTTLNRQGNDVGTQYRSVVFYRNETQKDKIQTLIKALNDANVYPSAIVTQVEPFTKFYKAEDYHQNYYNDNKEQGYCRFVIQPKIKKLENVFKNLLKQQ